MPINENIAAFIRRYKRERNLSMAGLSEELCIAQSALQTYLKGAGNPKADTIDLLAERSGVSPAEIVSAHPQGWERAEIMERALRLFGDLPPEWREQAVKLFLTLTDILSEDYHT